MACRARASSRRASSQAPTFVDTVKTHLSHVYGHYDVVGVGAGDEALWSSPPFDPVERDGALFGRGTADSKANVIAHVGALRAWEGRSPVGLKVVIEGQEEVGSAFNVYPPSDPEAEFFGALAARAS